MYFENNLFWYRSAFITIIGNENIQFIDTYFTIIISITLEKNIIILTMA